MIDLVLEQLSSDQIQALLKPFWLDANQLTGRLPADLRTESQKILGDIRALIFRNEPVPQWEPALANSFHRLASELLLREFKRGGQGILPDELTRLQLRTTQLCNLAFVAVVPLETRYEVARTWLALRLPNPLSPEETPIDIAAAAVQAFAWSDIPADLLRVHLQATIVCHHCCPAKIFLQRIVPTESAS